MLSFLHFTGCTNEFDDDDDDDEQQQQSRKRFEQKVLVAQE